MTCQPFVTAVSRHIRRIQDNPAVCMYLVEGTDRAVLIDTSLGLGDLPGFLRNYLHEKPYFVLLTHGHVDHVSGADQFWQARLHPADWGLVKKQCDTENRWNYLLHCKEVLGERFTLPDPSALAPMRDAAFLPLEDGQTFDLGGVTVIAYHVPGHTEGSIVLFIPEEGYAMFGDACGTGALLLGDESTTVERYHQSLLRLEKIAPPFRG